MSFFVTTFFSSAEEGKGCKATDQLVVSSFVHLSWSCLVHQKKIRKNNIAMQTSGITYLYHTNTRIVYDIFPYAHSLKGFLLGSVCFTLLLFYLNRLLHFFEPFPFLVGVCLHLIFFMPQQAILLPFTSSSQSP